MKKLAITILLLALASSLALAGETKQAMQANESSWVISFGGAIGSEPADHFPVGGGWYLGLETPAVASSWTLALAYTDVQSKLGTVGFRYYLGTESVWVWLGGGIGVAKIDRDLEDYAPGTYLQAGLAIPMTDHLSFEFIGDVGVWRSSTEYTWDYEGYRKWCGCPQPDITLPVDSWEVVPVLKGGLAINF